MSYFKGYFSRERVIRRARINLIMVAVLLWSIVAFLVISMLVVAL